MSLRTKIISAIVCSLLVFGSASLSIFLFVIKPSFSAIEEKEAIQDIQRVIFALEDEINHLNSMTRAWAAWDATYDFILLPSEEFITENLTEEIFHINSINLIFFYDANGLLLWGESYDLETNEAILLNDFSGKSLTTGHLLLNFPATGILPGAVKKGIWMTEKGPLMLAAVPIFDPEGNNTVGGFLVMGSLLNQSVVSKVASLTRIDFDLFSMNTTNPPGRLGNLLNTLKAGSSYVIDKVDDARLKIYSTIPDITRQKGIVVAATIPRDIHNRSQIVTDYAVLTFAMTVIFTFILLSYFLHKIVVGPINFLTNHVTKIGRTANMASTIEVQTADEIGALTKEFNSMIRVLHDSKHRIQEQSYQLGMAELASGILHNLRNSLHKIFSNCEQISKAFDQVPTESLMRARQELKSDDNTEARKADLVEYLDTSNATLLHFVSQTKDQIDKNHLVIHEIEKMLKNYEVWAFSDKHTEPILMPPIIQEAYQLLNYQYQEAVTLVIDPSVNKLGYIESNRVILIHVIVNLLSNAVESIQQMLGHKGEITVKSEIKPEDNMEFADISFCDNGAGISKDDLDHIFEMGFSTKDETNTGIGLHWCINTVKSMNGTIYAESEGKGLGACFHLVLPTWKE